MHHLADRTEFLRGVAADKAVDLQKLFVGKAEIGLADWHELRVILRAGPDPEGVIGIIRRAFAVAALRIHQNGIDDMRIALPFPPLALGTSRQIKRIAALEHHALDGLGILAGAGTRWIASRRGECLPAVEGNRGRQVYPGIAELFDKSF